MPYVFSAGIVRLYATFHALSRLAVKIFLFYVACILIAMYFSGHSFSDYHLYAKPLLWAGAITLVDRVICVVVRMLAVGPGI